jgi:hypothetical protein
VCSAASNEEIPLSGDGKVTGFLSRLAPRRAAEPQSQPVTTGLDRDPVVATKALKKFISSLRSPSSPVLLDLGPVVGSNIAFFGEQLGCKIFVEDVFADLDRFHREQKLAELPAFLDKRFPQADTTVDGILCWDLFDFLDRPTAQVVAAQLTRLLAVNGALFGFFTTAHPREARLTKFIVVDEQHLRHKQYSTPRMRQAVLQNRDIIRLFDKLRVSDSFLLHSNVREILFRKPAYLAGA